MKKLLLLLLTTLTLSFCNKDDDKTLSEIDKLPPATQTGANTFGCLLDGQAFIPSGGTNPLDCVYQYVNGGYYFGLQGNKRNSNNDRITIALGTNNLQIQQGLNYELVEDLDGNAFGIYSLSPNASYTSTFQTGELKITKLDTVNQIVAGTFWYDVKDQNGIVHQIREGRFDMQYTQ